VGGFFVVILADGCGVSFDAAVYGESPSGFSARDSACESADKALAPRPTVATAQGFCSKAPRFPSHTPDHDEKLTTRPRPAVRHMPFRKSMLASLQLALRQPDLTGGLVPATNPTGVQQPSAPQPPSPCPTVSRAFDLSGLTPAPAFSRPETHLRRRSPQPRPFRLLLLRATGLTSQLVKIPHPTPRMTTRTRPASLPAASSTSPSRGQSLPTDKHQIGLRITAVNVSTRRSV